MMPGLTAARRALGALRSGAFGRALAHRLARLSARGRLLGAALVVAAVSLAGFNLLVEPQLARLGSTRTLLAARERLLASGVMQARRLAEVEAGEHRLAARLAATRGWYCRARDVLPLIGDLADRARARDLEWEAVHVGGLRRLEPAAAMPVAAEPAPAAIECAALSIAFEVSGRAAAVLGFLDEIERVPRLVEVERLELRQEEGGRLRAAMALGVILLEGESDEPHAGNGVRVDAGRVGGDVLPGD